MKLWIDDIRPAPEGWVWAKTAVNAIAIISAGQVEEISFDHDLGENVASGYAVASWLERMIYIDQLDLPKWHIHSANPVGRENISRAMKSAERFVSREK